ncbi:hypothetical protein [Phosphitispora sp. TUW77]|uniref:hypothetical protein n=1 Tax=Phosphitispora sp. TUW77 TaxID=3152361 RepID=UPI003AB30C76
MKRFFLLLFIILIVVGSSGCTGSTDNEAKQNGTESTVSATTQKAILAIKNDDMEKLSGLIHPAKGVRFSPYAYVNTDAKDGNLVFNSDQVKNFLSDNQKYNWGYYDGSGEPIKLTPAEYFKRFVYTADFADAEQSGIVSFNKTVGTGNALENQFEVYPDAVIVEYYFSGFEEQYEGMDWQSLRLAYEKLDNDWYLVGIIHNQWTI